MSNYNTEDFLNRQDEMEVLFSVMSDGELMSLRDRVQDMMKKKVYESDGFPLSGCGLGFIIATIMFSFWVRKGKGVKIEMGEVVVCELKDSPFYKRYEERRVGLDSIDGEGEPKPEPKKYENVEKEVEGEWI